MASWIWDLIFKIINYPPCLESFIDGSKLVPQNSQICFLDQPLDFEFLLGFCTSFGEVDHFCKNNRSFLFLQSFINDSKNSKKIKQIDKYISTFELNGFGFCDFLVMFLKVWCNFLRLFAYLYLGYIICFYESDILDLRCHLFKIKQSPPWKVSQTVQRNSKKIWKSYKDIFSHNYNNFEL